MGPSERKPTDPRLPGPGSSRGTAPTRASQGKTGGRGRGPARGAPPSFTSIATHPVSSNQFLALHPMQ